MISKDRLSRLEKQYKDGDWIWMNKEVTYLLEGRAKKRLCIIDLTIPAIRHWENFEKIKSYILRSGIKTLKEYPKILLLVRNEALPNYRWRKIIQVLQESTGKPIDDIMVVDAGATTDNTYPHIPTNPFVINHALDLSQAVNSPTPIRQRKTFYNSLSRNPKNFRLLFTLELIKRGLLDQGCVSFGVSDDYSDVTYQQLIPADLTHLFPMYADGVVKRNDYTSTYPQRAIDSVIKVVLESTYDDVVIPDNPHNLSYCGGVFSDRVMLTEKTFFGFQSHQIPLYVTVQGHVQVVRDLGFDVFDDIVDHSYDSESDPAKRIQMVADELERLLHNKDSILSATDVDVRLQRNNDHRLVAYDNIGKQLKDKLTVWFNQ